MGNIIKLHPKLRFNVNGKDLDRLDGIAERLEKEKKQIYNYLFTFYKFSIVKLIEKKEISVIGGDKNETKKWKWGKDEWKKFLDSTVIFPASEKLLNLIELVNNNVPFVKTDKDFISLGINLFFWATNGIDSGGKICTYNDSSGCWLEPNFEYFHLLRSISSVSLKKKRRKRRGNVVYIDF